MSTAPGLLELRCRVNLNRPVAEKDEKAQNPKVAAWAFQSQVWKQTIGRCIELVDARRQAANTLSEPVRAHACARVHTHARQHTRACTDVSGS